MSNGSVPAKTGFSRVFTIEGRARPDHTPKYQSCMKGGSPSQSYGDVEDIECPSPTQYNDFDKVGEIQAAVERATMDLVGRYASDLASDLLRTAKRRCDIDVQIHFGLCTDPKDFNSFTKALIFEKAKLTEWSSEDVGALGSDENAKIDETAPISAREIYEALPLKFAEVCGDVVTNPVIDVVICDIPSCGDCEVESDGCQRIFALTKQTVGSPGTPADIIWTRDKFETECYSDNINTLPGGTDADALACLGDDVVVVSNADGALHYKSKADIWAAVVGGWTQVATGFVTGGEPNDIWSVGTYAFIVGDTGYVYGLSDPSAGVTVLDAGVASTSNLNAVHALDEDFAVAVGDSDAVIYTTNGSTWTAASGNPGSGGNLLCVWMRNQDEWWVGTSTGQVFYTLDGGVTWTEEGLAGTGYSNIYNIAFSTDSVGYIAADTTSTRGRVLRTLAAGGGHGTTGGFYILPEGSGALPLADAYYALAVCPDPNFVVAVGLGDNGTDGIVITGND